MKRARPGQIVTPQSSVPSSPAGATARGNGIAGGNRPAARGGVRVSAPYFDFTREQGVRDYLPELRRHTPQEYERGIAEAMEQRREREEMASLRAELEANADDSDDTGGDAMMPPPPVRPNRNSDANDDSGDRNNTAGVRPTRPAPKGLVLPELRRVAAAGVEVLRNNKYFRSTLSSLRVGPQHAAKRMDRLLMDAGIEFETPDHFAPSNTLQYICTPTLREEREAFKDQDSDDEEVVHPGDPAAKLRAQQARTQHGRATREAERAIREDAEEDVETALARVVNDPLMSFADREEEMQAIIEDRVKFLVVFAHLKDDLYYIKQWELIVQ